MLLFARNVGETHYYEDCGWNGKTLVPLPDAPHRVLQIWTYCQPQGLGGLETHAYGLEKQGEYLHFEDGEFCQRVFLTYPKNLNITEQQVREQHERALAMLDAIARYASAYYAFREAVAKAA